VKCFLQIAANHLRELPEVATLTQSNSAAVSNCINIISKEQHISSASVTLSTFGMQKWLRTKQYEWKFPLTFVLDIK
jgi:hypothetical protein